MNRSWITAITLATVAGSGAAFTGVVANSHDAPSRAEALAPAPEALVRVESTTIPARTLNYQVGVAGTTTLAIRNGSLAINNATASSGWTLMSKSGPGTHINVRFTDGTQVVTFGADLVGDVVVVSLRNAPAAITPALEPSTTVATVEQPAAILDETASQPTDSTPPEPVAATKRPTAVKAATHSPSGDDGQSEPHDD